MGRVSTAILLLGAGVATWQAGREWEEDELRHMHMVRVTCITVDFAQQAVIPTES